MGDVGSDSSLELPVSLKNQSLENNSVESVGLLHEKDNLQGPLWPKELDNMLLRNDDGVELALSYAKMWSKYTKDIVTWVEKKISLELECARNVAKMAETTKSIIGLQEFMPFHALFLNAFDNDIESSQLSQQTAGALQANKFVQPLLGRKNELDKQRKAIKELWQREQKKMQETETSLKKAKLLCIQQQTEYEKAKSSTVRAEEEYLSSSGGLGREASKQLEKKRRLEEEALQKVEEANEHYKVVMIDMEERRNDLDHTKSEILTQLRELVFQCDLTLKAVVVNLFQMQHEQVVSLPVNYQSLCENAKLCDPGRKFAEFVKAKTSPKDEVHIKSSSFENSKIDGFLSKGSTNNQHGSHGNVSQNSGDCTFHLLEDIGSPVYHSKKIGDKRSCSSLDIPAVRGRPPPVRSWSVGHQSGGMCSDSESAGGSSESRSMDSPSASPGDFKRRLPRTPSMGTMSSADELDEREPPSPSEIGLNDHVPENTSFPGPFRSALKSKAALSHKLRKLRTPSKCRECDSLVIFHGAECVECSLACHKTCLETLTIQCGHKKLHGKLHLFGVEFAQAAKNAPDGIPFIIKKCTSEIESRALNVKGIYRVNGAKNRVEKLCQSFENGTDLVELSEFSAHDVSNVLKLYLRKLPEPLFLFHLYDELIGLAKESQNVNEDSKQTSPEVVGAELNKILKKIKVLLKKLPGPNYNTIEYLIGHLNRVVQKAEENKMPASNLGIIFGPTLIRPWRMDAKVSPSSLVDYPHQARIVELLIAYFVKIFDVSLQPPSASSANESFTFIPRNPQSCLASKESILPSRDESKISERATSFERSHDHKNALEGADGSVIENAMSLVFDETETYPFKNKDKFKANSRSHVKGNQITLRSPRIKTSIRPVSLPVDQFLPPNFLNENNSKNMETLNADKFVRSSTIEEISETKSFPNSSSRLSCFDPKTWDKQFRQYDVSTRTTVIMSSALQENREPENGATCVLSLNSNNPSSSAMQLTQADMVPVRAARITAEGCTSDSNLPTFRPRRTLQPPPGTFYKPPSNNKVKENGESFPETYTAEPVSVNHENTVDIVVNSDSPGQRVNQPKAGPEELHASDVKPTCQRLRPKRIQDLEQREAQFV
ncbi:rho GTPase-activating protein 29-like [Trichosurus vulpecula]|uniref:rho GTPase-activating protein 29-like n=1 Tax=Trichosurus vulpecula TaxID=9337 RepID=UPI00186B4FDB|nr:rho GTPase-activating protein 29-like [Trichosurus vulpecula]XP_036622489.1 rho GTPase-activating protein 29-like [Trichosurus vulpecula]